MRERKFIIIKDWTNKNVKIRIGYPIYHRDLLNKDDEKNHLECVGGGRWMVNFETKKFKLFGSSDDFGNPNKKDIEQAIKNLTKHDWWQISWIIEQVYEVEINEDELAKYKFIIDY